MFASYLFHRLGINWGITLLASFATLMVPIPIWFYLRGEQVCLPSTRRVDGVGEDFD